jgi:plastocyanin
VLTAALVAGLSAGHKAGLAVVAGIFVLFAVGAALLIPSRWPDFPGGSGLRPFLVASAGLFAAMLLAVIFFAKESESEAKEPPAAVGGAAHIANVREVDFKIELPATTVEHGDYTFDLTNAGKSMHNLAIKGPGIAGKQTPTIDPGGKARLEVRLQPGTYELYSTVPGHKQLGMEVKLNVT